MTGQEWEVTTRRRGTGVICETWALEAAVIPAKAGIYSANLRKCAVDGLDSRFRGNDRRFKRDPIPNDTTTGDGGCLTLAEGSGSFWDEECGEISSDMRKKYRRWLWLGIGAIIIALIFYNLSRSPEWGNFRWTRLWALLTGASPGLLLLTLIAVFATYFVRALRWRFFLSPIKKASLWVLFVGQILGFSSIYLIGRPGEFVRPAYIAKKENVSMSAMLAVWLLERIFDTVFLVLLFAAALDFEPVEPETARGTKVLATLHRGGDVMLVLAVLLVVGLLLFWLRSGQFTAWMLRLFRFLPVAALRRFERFLRSFAEGLSVIRSWKDLLGSLALTAVVWFLNTSVFWLVFQSLRGEVAALPWPAAAVTLFCAALGLAVQIPGIGGGYQVGIILALNEFFNVPAEVATGAAILLWIIMSVPCLVAGLVLLVHEGLTLRKLEALAEEEREVLENN
ncbi:MAG: lysylphosphatidylglycerol synthase transmembrane domain-containing protein [Terriglobia bacterium]